MDSDANNKRDTPSAENQLFVESPKIKREPFTDWRFNPHEKVNLCSDDEDNDDLLGRTTSTKKSKQKGNDKKSAHSKSDIDQEKVQQVKQLQQQMIERFRQKQHAEAVSTDGDEVMSETLNSKAGFSKRTPANDAEAAKFQKLKQAFLEKRRAQKLSHEDEIAFMQAEFAESSRLRKLELDYEFDNAVEDDNDEPSTSAEAHIPTFSALHSEEEDESEKPKRARKRRSNDDGAGKPTKRAKRGKAGKKDRAVPGTEYTEGDLDDVLVNAKKSKKTAGPKTKAGGRKKSNGPTMVNLDSVFAGSNVFEDTAATAGLAEQPKFDKQSRRDEAMKQLIASVPVEDLTVAKSDKKFLDDAIKNFNGQGSVKPVSDGLWDVKGMRTPLKHFQILGTAFMLKRENGSQPPYGGIVADQMGLGKTIMMLANVINNKPKARSKARTTLIVASPALITQWFEQIKTHCLPRREDKHGIGRVVQFRSGSRMKSNEEEEVLEDCEIVLTSYSEVSKSYPKAVIPAELTTSTQKDAWWREFYEKNRGILHRIKWHRVVLDECQTIKNHRSHTSMACRALDTKHPWAISGTPILNKVAELYPYFKFIREPSTGSYRAFKLNYCSPDDPDGVEKIGVMLRKFMIKRTHLDRLFNARLLELPPPQEHTIWLEFNEVERQIYEVVKKRFIQRINMISKHGAVEREYNHIWSLMLRLRQLCNHLLLVQSTVTDLLEFEDYQKLNRITESEQEMTDEGTALLLHLREVLRNTSGAKVIESSLGSATLTENESLPPGMIDTIGDVMHDVGGTHGVHFRFRKYLDDFVDSPQFEALKQRTLCCGCRQTPHEPHVTSCGHVFCLGCLRDSQHLAARRGLDSCRCPECGEAYTSADPAEELRAEQRHTTSTSTAEVNSGKKNTKGKKEESGVKDWIDMDGAPLCSAKTAAVKAQVLNWLSENENVKIIIFSQFVDMLRILSKVCRQEGWNFLEYSGRMSHDSRGKAIQEFREDPTKTILLASLKCGGLGLNLTMAQRVLIVDPWWNDAIENQAFCRVFRIGQDKTTCLTRLYVNNTIETSIMNLKKQKQIAIDEVMSETKRKESLTVRDLMRLFGGRVEDDEEGRPFIFPNEDELEPEHLRVPNVDDEDEFQRMGNET